MRGPGCFFCCGPFLLVPRVIGFYKIFGCRPRVCKVFFFVALRWAPRPFGGARAKKKTPPRVFFFCSGPGERQGKEKPRWKPARGQSKKKNTTQGVFFFAAAPAKGKGRRSPVGRRHGARAKSLFFFLLWPRAGAQRGFSFPCLSPGPEQKKKHPGWCFFLFCSGPVPASNGASPSLAFRRGRSKKKHPGWCFFFCSGPVPASNGASPSLAFRRGRSKKKTPWVVFFFFAAAPRGRSLTHCGPGWRCLPPAGAVFFFLLRPRPDRGGVFFFAVAPPGRSLTHGGLGRFRQGPGGVFFLLRPRRVFLDNSKKCLGYYIGSKKTRRGHSFPCLSPGPEQKKNTLGGVFFLLWPRAGFQRGFSFPCLSPGPQQKKHPGWCFFLLWPHAGFQRGFSFPCLSPGPQQKKNTLGGVFFFYCGPARTLTHSLRAWVAMPPPRRGGVFFLLQPRPDRCGVFFLLWPRPDAHSLTVGWGDFGKARVVFFFLLRPRRVFLENSKKCLGYYIGSKKTRRGHSKKKTPLPRCGLGSQPRPSGLPPAPLGAVPAPCPCPPFLRKKRSKGPKKKKAKKNHPPALNHNC